MKYLFLILIFVSIIEAKLIRKNSVDVVYDTQTNLMWVDSISVVKLQKTHEESILYCDNLIFAGYSNWRLPELEEFTTIVNKKNHKNYIAYAFKYNLPTGYWAKKAHWRTFWFYADYMNFISGTGYYDSRHKTKFVRCVRNMKEG